MKDITIKIVGKQFDGDKVGNEMVFVSDGKMYKRAGAHYLVYDDSELFGFAGTRTRLKITEDTVRMKRIGKPSDDVYDEGFESEMVFQEGKRFQSIYATPYGAINMEVLTKNLKNDLSPEGFGKVSLDYVISFQGAGEGRNELDIEITQ